MDKIDGRYLRELREEHGYSLRVFADKIYASKSSVQRWEQSFVPENADILNKISEVFGISVEDMREQSQLKYGINKEKEEEPFLDFEQRAEIEFSIRNLEIVIGFLFVGLIIFFIVFL